MRFVWPVPGFNRVSSPFGMRTLNGKPDNHRGIDIGRNLSPARAIDNADIVAIASGRVTASFFSPTGGNMIVIDHGNGVQSRYLHNSINLVTVSQNVRQGELIGRVGNTGHSFGAHLHLDIIINGVHVDPMLHFGAASQSSPPISPQPQSTAQPPEQQPQHTAPPLRVSNLLFRVQAGAFGVEANASAMRDRLRERGHNPTVLRGEDNLFRVQVDAFGDRADAEKLVVELERQGFDSLILPIS